MSKIDKLIAGDMEAIEDENFLLRKAYWQIIVDLRMSAGEWMQMVRNHTNNPRYNIKSEAEPEDRAARLRTAMTGNNIKGVPVELSWKRFIEAVTALNCSMLTVTVETSRGNYGTKQLASASCRPSEDLLKYLTEPPRTYSEAVSASLSRYFANPENTANNVMTHILLRIFWKLVALYKIDEAMWLRLSKQYVRSFKGDIQERRRNDKRNNLQTTIRASDRITWQRFLEALKAIDCRSLECTFRLDFPNAPTVESTIFIDLTSLVLWSTSNEPE